MTLDTKEYPALRYYDQADDPELHLANVPCGVAMFAFDGKHCYLCNFNDLFIKAHGISSDVYFSSVKHDMLDIVDPEDRERLLSHISAIVNNEIADNLEISYKIISRTSEHEHIFARFKKSARTINGMKTFIGSFDNVTVLFHEGEDAARNIAEQKHTLLNEIEKAIREREFLVYYQPIFSASTKNLISAEALVRWQHPERGLIPPGRFIPVIEREGLITKLDFYVWEEVCAYIRSRKDAGLPVVPVSVNMSRVDIFDPDLLEKISSLTDRYGIRSGELRFEITESAYSENPERIRKVMCALQNMGFSILMDDFGSGYSSLAILKDLDVDIIKIERAFVLDVATNERAANVLGSVIRLTRRLRIPTVIEGVETKEQFDFMRGLGCDSIQGYYFARPDTAERLDELIAERRGTADECDVKAFAKETVVELAPKGDRRTILIVDDQSINRMILNTLLKEYYEIIEAENGRVALDLINQYPERIDLVLLDIVMPVFNGFDFLEEIKASGDTSSIPVIVMTDANSDENEILALEYGACDFIKKPFQNEIIMMRIANQLRLRELANIKNGGNAK